MKIKDIYDDLYKECDHIFGSFILYLVNNFKKFFSDDELVDSLKTNYNSYAEYPFREKYQKWYTNSLIVISALLPERKEEFINLYVPNLKRKELNLLTYTIGDAISGYSCRNANPTTSINQLQKQIEIIRSLKDIIDMRIADVRLLIENDVLKLIEIIELYFNQQNLNFEKEIIYLH